MRLFLSLEESASGLLLLLSGSVRLCHNLCLLIFSFWRSGHYLGGRAFGPILIAGTVFASLFSGYTVVGIPNESFKGGFQGFRWMPSTAYIAAGYIGTGVRLRKASMVRNHASPVDFITGMYSTARLVFCRLG